MKYQITFSKITEKATLKCRKLKIRKKWVGKNVTKLRETYMENSKKISLDKSKQFFSFDYKFHIISIVCRELSSPFLVFPLHGRPANPLFWNSWYTYWRDLVFVFFFSLKHVTENWHNQVSWFLALESFDGILIEEQEEQESLLMRKL